MKTIFSVVIFLLTQCVSYSQYDIRNANWGWSRESVKKSETLPVFRDKAALMYKDTLEGREVVIAYHFLGDKLNKVDYVCDELPDDNSYISSYNELKAILSKKYGEPDFKRYWKSELVKVSEDKWGSALSSGHLKLVSTWETEKTRIILICLGGNSEIVMGISYTGKAYFNISDSEKKKKTLRVF